PDAAPLTDAPAFGDRAGFDADGTSDNGEPSADGTSAIRLSTRTDSPGCEISGASIAGSAGGRAAFATVAGAADAPGPAERAAAHPSSLTGPPKSNRRPPSVAATTIASVEVPLAGSPSGVRTPASASAMTLASVTVITRLTSAPGAAAASTTRMVLIVEGSHAATALRPALAG